METQDLIAQLSELKEDFNTAAKRRREIEKNAGFFAASKKRAARRAAEHLEGYASDVQKIMDEAERFSKTSDSRIKILSKGIMRLHMMGLTGSLGIRAIVSEEKWVHRYYAIKVNKIKCTFSL